MKSILLGTQSKYKIALFQKLGIPFETAAPPYEERPVPGLSPEALALHLAEGKAQSLRLQHQGKLIIGADQVLALEDRVLSKPGSVQAAVDQLLALSGKTHYLHTAFCVLDAESGELVQEVVTAEITFWPNLDPSWLRTLVERDQTTDCVGAYKFECGGILLMEKVVLEDPNAIVGLPLMRLARALGRWGWLDSRFVNEK